MIPDIELAWAAGFFDADGCTTSSGEEKSFRPRIAVGQSHPDLEALLRFQVAVGCGHITGPHPASKSGNPHWVFHTSYIETLATMDKLWPYLTEVKRQQFLRLLRKYESTHRGKKRWVRAVEQFEATRFPELLRLGSTPGGGLSTPFRPHPVRPTRRA